MGELTASERTQRELAARKHGAYSFEQNGEKALDTGGRTRLAELREAVQDRGSLVDILGEKCADQILLFELIQSYVAQRVKAGTPLEEIPALKYLPQFANSMQRAIALMLANMPAEDGTDAELARINGVLDGNYREATES